MRWVPCRTSFNLRLFSSGTIWAGGRENLTETTSGRRGISPIRNVAGGTQ